MAMAPTDHTGAAMATTNPTLSGPNWQLIVAAGDEFLLSLPQASQTVYIAVGEADDSDPDSDPQPPAADLLGPPLASGRDGMNRSLPGPGPVFAKCIDPSASVLLALTAWTPA